MSPNFLKLTFITTNAYFGNYVCVNCGYAESYISDSNKLRAISENWVKVTVRE